MKKTFDRSKVFLVDEKDLRSVDRSEGLLEGAKAIPAVDLTSERVQGIGHVAHAQWQLACQRAAERVEGSHAAAVPTEPDAIEVLEINARVIERGFQSEPGKASVHLDAGEALFLGGEDDPAVI